MKELNGKELSGYVKARQASEVRSLKEKKIFPRLVILRDSDNPVIMKYISLKKLYGSDIGVIVDDIFCSSEAELKQKITEAGNDPSVSGIIVQLPLKSGADTDTILSRIPLEKDVDGLTGKKDTATATAINWLLAGYGVELAPPKKLAIVGRGRLVGAPLFRMFENSGYSVKMFHRGDDLSELKNYDVIITATGSPRVIKSEFISRGAVIVDAGTASEGGVLVGDADDALRARTDLGGITPKIGGVGPLTVSALFDAVINSAKLVK